MRHRAVLASMVAVGCGDRAGLAVDLTRGQGHGGFDAVELALTETGEVVALWSVESGWRDPLGQPLEVLPPAVWSGEAVEPLRAGGAPASLEVRLRGERAPDIGPRGDSASVGGNPCGEHSARYFPLDDETPIIAWPNAPHPDWPEGPALFAERSKGGGLVQIFHCDRLDIYPEQAGLARLEIVLWHVSHADQASDALSVEVLEAR